MKLKSLNKYASLLIFIISFLPVNAEEQIDIWDNKDVIKKEEKSSDTDTTNTTNNNTIFNKIKNNKLQLKKKY